MTQHSQNRSTVLWHNSALLLLLLAAAERDLKAYADPGTGAMLWQVLVAAVIGALYYIRKAARLFRKKDRKD